MPPNRVVITGLGVIAPNAIGLQHFEQAIYSGVSGIRYLPELQDKKFRCQVGGIPEISEEVLARYFPSYILKRWDRGGIIYGCMAGYDAWQDAGLVVGDATDWDSGCIIGTGLSSVIGIRNSIHLVDAGKVKHLGNSAIQQIMTNGVSARLAGMLGLGNQVTTNASACSTGTEAIIMGYERIQSGKAKRMLVGGCDSDGAYMWSGFDSMRVLSSKYNDTPTKASRPMSASTDGFVPGGGAGVLVLEDYETAKSRNANIYAEVLGGHVNSGGHKNGGSVFAPNPKGIEKCIDAALHDANVTAAQIDAISGHLTGTAFDPHEIRIWSKTLNRQGKDFPFVSSLKSMVGHCLSAAGAIESIAAVLQVYKGFLHPSLNCEDLHGEIANTIDSSRIPLATQDIDLHVVAKSSFGFGDVNSVVIFGKI